MMLHSRCVTLSSPGARMIPCRLLLTCALVAGALLPARAEYIAETGRTQKKEIPADSVSELAGAAAAPSSSSASQADPHAALHHHDHASHDDQSAGESAGPARTSHVTLEELYSASVEKALLESGIEKLAVQSEGVNVSLRTFAEVQVNAITGQTRLKMENGKRMDPVYAVLGMIYQNKAWVHAPIIPIENPQLARRLGLESGVHHRVSPVWVMKTPAARSRVMPALQGMKAMNADLPEEERKALDKFAYRIGAFLSLPNEFKLVPLVGETSGEWLAPTHLKELSRITDADLQKKVAALDRQATPYGETLALDAAILRAYDEKEPGGVAPAVAALLQAVDGTPEYMASAVRKLDYWNTRIHPFKRAAQLSMLSFFAFLIYLFTVRRRSATAGKGDGGSGSGSSSRRPEPGSAAEAAPAAAGAAASLVSAFAPASPSLALPGGGTVAACEAVAALPAASAASASAAAGSEGAAVSTVTMLRRPSPTGAAAYGDPGLLAEQEVGEGSRLAWGIGYGLLIASAGTMIAALVIRFFIGGRMPVSNMYESITFAMAAFAVVSVIFEGIYRRAWVGIGAAFAGWTLMTLANSLPLHMRKVEPLVAVLKSVWLNYHVTALLISYSAFLLAFVCGVLYFVKDFTGNRPGALPRKEMFEYISYRAIQVGWPLLTVGIFLGAVWANTAWGSYWSWDPKETWALITWFAYTIYLHLRMIMGWSDRRAVVANMVGFLMVLITYFGVSYLPGLSGGMHSYASPVSN